MEEIVKFMDYDNRTLEERLLARFWYVVEAMRSESVRTDGYGQVHHTPIYWSYCGEKTAIILGLGYNPEVRK